MTIEKRFHDGAWVISDVINGFLVTRVYMGYSKKEAITMFKRDSKE